jgi:outer membrane lipopolysaccharide assembly protein LptE/RlpB
MKNSRMSGGIAAANLSRSAARVRRAARFVPWIVPVLLAFAATGCGYHVAGRGDTIPKNVKTIAIPAFTNRTTNYRLAQGLPEAITREFISRTRYRVVPEADGADAVLSGSIINASSYPIISDQKTGRATAVQFSLRFQISLKTRDGKVLFSRPNMEVHDRFEISIDPNAYFEESDAMLDRLNRETAASIVSAVLENF